MQLGKVKNRLTTAWTRLVVADRYLLENNVGERCIAARVALQPLFSKHAVDVEYNRLALDPKRLLGLPPECAKYRNEFDQSLAVPDLIVHCRGRRGPHLLSQPIEGAGLKGTLATWRSKILMTIN